MQLCVSICCHGDEGSGHLGATPGPRRACHAFTPFAAGLLWLQLFLCCCPWLSCLSQPTSSPWGGPREELSRLLSAVSWCFCGHQVPAVPPTCLAPGGPPHSRVNVQRPQVNSKSRWCSVTAPRTRQELLSRQRGQQTPGQEDRSAPGTEAVRTRNRGTGSRRRRQQVQAALPTRAARQEPATACILLAHPHEVPAGGCWAGSSAVPPPRRASPRLPRGGESSGMAPVLPQCRMPPR